MTDIHSCSYYCNRPECIKAQRDELRDRLAQPEQEPVAWMVLGDGEYGEYAPGMHFDTVGYKEYWERRGYELQPLYTAPPQRKKLPPQTPCLLTQAENKMFRFGWLECEAAHGIKGEA